MTKQWLVDNPASPAGRNGAGSLFSVKKKRKIFLEKMAAIKSNFSGVNSARSTLRRQKLKKFQSEADSPEAAATIPKLRIEDIPQAMETIPSNNSMLGRCPDYGS